LNPFLELHKKELLTTGQTSVNQRNRDECRLLAGNSEIGRSSPSSLFQC